jgi:type I restriction enzyme, S subunit
MILAHSFPVAISEVPLTINQDMKAIICGPRIYSDFMFWSLSGHARALVALGEESAHGTRKLETPVLSKFLIPLPPLSEQTVIVDYLETETAKIDRMIARVEHAIERLQEYRAALITSVVTGKIDLREMLSEGEAAALAAAG